MPSYANPIQVQKFLKGASYPASKSDLISVARQESADDDVISTLERLPERSFGNPAEVSEEIRRNA